MELTHGFPPQKISTTDFWSERRSEKIGRVGRNGGFLYLALVEGSSDIDVGVLAREPQGSMCFGKGFVLTSGLGMCF